MMVSCPASVEFLTDSCRAAAASEYAVACSPLHFADWNADHAASTVAIARRAALAMSTRRSRASVSPAVNPSATIPASFRPR